MANTLLHIVSSHLRQHQVLQFYLDSLPLPKNNKKIHTAIRSFSAFFNRNITNGNKITIPGIAGIR
jgi:hypothetical protein